ncbi:MAG: PKD domain-containing protein, partial [Candidatus Kapaibacterium sp.]
NEELIDSITKEVLVEKLDIDVTKELDFEIEYVSKDPLIVKFVVPEIYDFKSFSWNFGDGVAVPGNKVKYKYQDTGTYSVTLTAIREDGTFKQEIKADVVSSSEINLDYNKPLFEKFRLRDNKRFYFKPLKTLNNVHIRVFDKNEILLFDEEYIILSRGEVNSITSPVDEIYTIQVETSDGEVYEY